MPERSLAGIALAGGKQYSIVLSTNSETDTVDGWNVSDGDPIDQATTAARDGSSWPVFQSAPGLAFAVQHSN